MSHQPEPATASAQRPTDRVTVLLPPWLFRRVVADARRRMVSLSAVIRERLADHYRDEGEQARP